MRNLLAKGNFLTITLLLMAGVAYSQKFQANPNIERRVDALLSQLSPEEKISLVGGDGFGVRGIARLGLPPLVMSDGPYGVRRGRATVLAAGIGLAASWNSDLARSVGEVIGEDARTRGIHFQLAPGVNIYRSSQNGRNFEYFGEDPFLASQMAVEYIKGIQSQGVCAVIKHFLGNNSEYARNYSDAIIGERALREIYLPAFEAAVKQGHVGAVMDSYNLVNGTYMSANRLLNVNVLKRGWGFQGLLMSDWTSTHGSLGAINGGLDLEMPTGVAMNRESILAGLSDGTVKMAMLNDKVRRLLRTEIRFGWLDRPQLIMAPLLNEHGEGIALQSARESIVLLKNERQILPLQKEKLRTVAIIGPLAYPAVPVGGGSSQATPFESTSLLVGMSHMLGTGIPVLYDRGLPTYARVAEETHFTTDRAGKISGIKLETFANMQLLGSPVDTRVNEHLSIGKFLNLNVSSGEEGANLECCAKSGDSSYRWSGYYAPKMDGMYRLVIFQSGGGEKTGYRIRIDGKLALDNWRFPRAIVDELPLYLHAGPHKLVVEFWTKHSSFVSSLFRIGIRRDGTWVAPSTMAIAAKADAVILAVGFNPTTEFEGWDRTFHLPPGQQELIERVAAANPHTIVVLQGGGNVDMSSWINQVPALLDAWYPGQEGGEALAEILTGKISPSGHLPVTFERRPEDNPTFGNYYPHPADYSPTPKIEYKEGIFVGYRGYDHKRITPRFAFGFGLSYTTFRYKNLVIRPDESSQAGAIYNVSFDVMNTGSLTGKAVTQLYISPFQSSVIRPPKELKGFAKVELAPGETRKVTLPLDVRAFTYYDTDKKEWLAPAGVYNVLVGSSSDAIELSVPIRIKQTLSEKP